MHRAAINQFQVRVTPQTGWRYRTATPRNGTQKPALPECQTRLRIALQQFPERFNLPHPDRQSLMADIKDKL